MKATQIASILNTQIVQNALGQTVTIAEDLSNIVEVAKAISSLSGDSAKNFQKTLFIELHNYFIVRELDRKDYGILKTAIEYCGGIQRIMDMGSFTAQDSHILNLVNGTSYLDGKYYGSTPSAVVVEDTKLFKVVHSVAPDNFNEYFASAEKAISYFSMVEVKAKNTITNELNELEKRVLTTLAYKAYKANRKVMLVTAFNAETNGKDPGEEGFLEWEDIKADRELYAYFNDWVKQTIDTIESAMTDKNTRYNDGTVENFAPEAKLTCTLIQKFASAIKFLSDPVDRNIPGMPVYKNISCWQNPGDTILPTLANASTIKVVDGESTDEVDGVVGIIFDQDAAGINIAFDKITVEEVGAEGFRNLHNHMAINSYVDTRLGSVVLVLE